MLANPRCFVHLLMSAPRGMARGESAIMICERGVIRLANPNRTHFLPDPGGAGILGVFISAANGAIIAIVVSNAYTPKSAPLTRHELLW